MSNVTSLTTLNAATPISVVGPKVPAFADMGQVLAFAQVMAASGIGLRKHLRNNPGACAAIAMQAMRWEMDPFAVANKSYEVNDQIAFESQLIASVINTRAPIVGRLKTRFNGAGDTRTCTASATFVGDSEPTEVTSPPFSKITPKNSPLWKTDPDQQLSYYTKRLWARRECPEVLLGVYDGEEVPRGPDHARDVTPLPPRPTRDQYIGAATDAEIVDPVTGEVTEEDEFDAALFIDGVKKEIAAATTLDAINEVTRRNSAEIKERLDDEQRAHLRAVITEAKAKFAPEPEPETNAAIHDIAIAFRNRIAKAGSIDELNAIGGDPEFIPAADYDEKLEPLMVKRRAEVSK